MIDLYEELENKITKALRVVNAMDGVNYLVTPSHQGSPESQLSYLSVFVADMASQREVRSGKYEIVDDNGVQKAREHIISHYTARVQLTFVGPEAGKFASNRHGNMLGGLVLQEFNRLSIAPTKKSSLRRNPQLRGTKWVNEFAFDLTVSYAVLTVDDTTEWVEKFTLLGDTIVVTN